MVAVLIPPLNYRFTCKLKALGFYTTALIKKSRYTALIVTCTCLGRAVYNALGGYSILVQGQHQPIVLSDISVFK